MHLVVEAKLGLTRAIFGQLAAVETRTLFTSARNHRKLLETLHDLEKPKARGQKLLREGRDELAQSERATFICWHEWLARSQANTKTMAQQAKRVREVTPAKELRKLDETTLAEICRHLDELSSHWSRLKVGEAMTVRWPDLRVLEGRKRGNKGTPLQQPRLKEAAALFHSNAILTFFDITIFPVGNRLSGIWPQCGIEDAQLMVIN